MLSFCQINKHHNFSLKEKSASYSNDLCRQFIFSFNNLGFIKSTLNKNIQIDNQINQLSGINLETLDKLSMENPLSIFPERYNHSTQNVKYGSSLRNYLESNILISLFKIDVKDHLIYTTYSSSFFQDLIILTKYVLFNRYLKKITLNLIGNFGYFLDSIYDESINPIPLHNKMISPNTFNKYVSIVTFRLIKIIEWFNSMDIDISCNIYLSHDDYVNECYMDNTLSCHMSINLNLFLSFCLNYDRFRSVSMVTTVTGGSIVFFENIQGEEYNFIILKNIDQINFLDNYGSYYDEICELLDGLDCEMISINSSGESVYIQDDNIIKKEGKEYKLSRSSSKHMLVYRTEKCNNIQKQINQKKDNFFNMLSYGNTNPTTILSSSGYYGVYLDVVKKKFTNKFSLNLINKW